MRGEHAVAKPRHAEGGAVGEPHGAVRGEGEPVEPRDGVVRQCERGDRSVRRDAGDRPRGRVREPRGAVGGHGDSHWLHARLALGKLVDLPVPEDADGVGGLDGDPDAAVRPDGDRGGDVARARHRVLGEAGAPPRAEAPRDERARRDDHQEADCQPTAAAPAREGGVPRRRRHRAHRPRSTAEDGAASAPLP